MSEPRIDYDIYIAALPDAVWAALTSPQFTQHYWGEIIETDWNEGSPIVATTPNGTEQWHGEVLDYEPTHSLGYTLCLADADDWRTRVHFEITDVTPAFSATHVTHLALAHDQFRHEDAFYEGSRIAWPRVLSSMKSLLESGRSLGLYQETSRAA